MARVDFRAVQELLADDLDSGVITALIDDAHGWISRHLSGRGHGEATLTSIEKYLAAHLCVIATEGGAGQLVASARGDVSEKYAARSDASDATSHLRAAAAFDHTGIIRQLWMNGKRAGGYVGRGYA